ncbi:MAG: hypothetical protein ACUVQ9_11995 [Thermodesulfobacteriota bacterium]
MSEFRELRIALPKYGISRYYIINFGHLAYPGLESVTLEENLMTFKSKGKDVREILIDSYLSTKEILTKYLLKGEDGRKATEKRDKKKKRTVIEIPVSGNEMRILEEVKGKLKSANVSIIEMLDKYTDELKHLKKSEIEEEYGSLNGEIPSISIFRPELYEYTRGPFSDGIRSSELVGYDSKHLTLGGFMMRLSGFIISRIGISALPSNGNKKEYVTTLLMPVVERITRSGFLSSIERLRSLGRVPNLVSPEGVTIWLSLILYNPGENSPDVIYLGMKNPGGQMPASISFGETLPINDYINKAERFLKELAMNQKKSEMSEKSIRSALLSELPEMKNLLSQLFLGSQGDTKAALEFMLRVSRKVKGVDPKLLKNKKARDEYDALKNLFYLSTDLVKSLEG